MATLIARYLLNEGSGTTVADSSGNGHHLTAVVGSGGWATLSNGDSCYRQSSKSSGVVLLPDNQAAITSAFEGQTQISLVLVTQDMVGSSSGVRGVHLGTESGNGHLMFGSSGSLNHDCRWLYEVEGEPSYDGRTHYKMNLADGDPRAVSVITFDMSQANTNKIQIYRDTVRLTNDSDTEGYNEGLSADLSWAQFSLLNRPGQNAGYVGRYGYVEIWSGILTSQEISDATDALLITCDEPWTGGPPPTSVSFTQQPTSTAITETTVTAQATAESDAP